MKRFGYGFALNALLLAGLTFVAGARAATIDCLAVTADAVSGDVACEVSISAKQDFQQDPMTVNQEAFFGFTDWEAIKKDDPLPNGQAGTWSLDAANWNSFSDIMLIFKSGKNTTLVGYLLAQNEITGTWESPFKSPQFDLGSLTRNVSHISYYGRGEPVKVPEPGSLLLLGLGLLGLALIRRRNAR